MEYCNGGSLETYKSKFNDRKLPEEEVRYIFKGIVEGVNELNNAGYVHRDLKPDNIFLHYEEDKEGLGIFGAKIKIGDLGFIRKFDDK